MVNGLLLPARRPCLADELAELAACWLSSFAGVVFFVLGSSSSFWAKYHAGETGRSKQQAGRSLRYLLYRDAAIALDE